MSDHDRIVEVAARAIEHESHHNWLCDGLNDYEADALAKAALTAIEAAGYRVVPVEKIEVATRREDAPTSPSADETSES